MIDLVQTTAPSMGCVCPSMSDVFFSYTYQILRGDISAGITNTMIQQDSEKSLYLVLSTSFLAKFSYNEYNRSILGMSCFWTVLDRANLVFFVFSVCKISWNMGDILRSTSDPATWERYKKIGVKDINSYVAFWSGFYARAFQRTRFAKESSILVTLDTKDPWRQNFLIERGAKNRCMQYNNPEI